MFPDWLTPKLPAPKKSRARTVLKDDGEGEERDKLLAKIRKGRYRKNHPGVDSNPEKVRQWMKDHPEEAKKAQKRWAKAHKDKINKYARDCRARKKARRNCLDEVQYAAGMWTEL